MNKELEQICEELTQTLRALNRIQPNDTTLPKGITHAEMHVITTIYLAQKHNKEINPSTVAAYNHTTKSALSQILKSLDNKEIINRSRSQSDSRSVILSLTEKGRLIAENADSDRKAVMEDLVEYLGEYSMKELAGISKKALEFFEKRNLIDHSDNVDCSNNPGHFKTIN